MTLKEGLSVVVGILSMITGMFVLIGLIMLVYMGIEMYSLLLLYLWLIFGTKKFDLFIALIIGSMLLGLVRGGLL
mgnify:FL=1